jgi:Bacterial Ig-like domain (group 2)
MIIQSSTSGSIQIKGKTLSGNPTRDFLSSEMFQMAASSQTQIIVSGSTDTNSTIQDALVNDYTSATTLTAPNTQVNVPLHPYLSGSVTFASSNTAVATVNTNGIVTPISAGDCNITIIAPGLGKRIVPITIVSAGGQTTTTFENFVSGSLGNHLTSQIMTAISGLTPPTFSGSPPYAYSSLINLFQPNGTRNTSGWWSAIDVTCIPQSIGTNGVLVTPRDMICAAHYGASNPVFRDNAGNTYDRIVTSARTLVSPSGDADILVATLNADLPDAITPVSVLPANFRSYLPNPQYGYPGCFTNQDRTLLLGDLTNTVSPDLTIPTSTNTTRAEWYYPVRVGDSGSPAFVVINGSLVLLTTWHYVGGGPIIADNLSQINAAITANGSPYSLAEVNLSGFDTY